ncbi:hypothetical protein FACS1894130_01850 [Spirochaetia bacterium]|nr:hypothetical protein FACS1894130_01850 [Spirochaetia bacterium]
MKFIHKIGFLSIILVSCSTNVFTQGTIPSVDYIKVNSYNSPNLNIANIDDFIKLMNDNKSHDVFVTGDLFIIPGPSVMYTININGYKNIVDLKNGNDKKFSNGASYYFALENNLPNQTEVDYYKQEGFLTNEDYQDAVRLGFTHSNIENMSINGFITKDDFQKNIKYLNRVIFLRDYKDWRSMEIQEPVQAQSSRNNNRNSETQRLENERNQRQSREQEGTAFLENVDIDFIIDKINRQRESITKLNNFDYYYINIPLESEKDSMFYYAAKFCQFQNIAEYKNNQSKYSIKNTDQVIKNFSFISVEEMIDADRGNIPNGNDYSLMCEYYITLEQLRANRDFITQLESIKQRYLQNFDENNYRADNQRRTQVRASEINNNRNSGKATNKSMFAFAIFALLKQAKGVPVTYSNFVQNIQKEYENMDIYRNLSFDQYVLSSVLSNIPSINSLVVNNPASGSFYFK